MRINKYIASCGGYSRRSAEQLILDKRVCVNGKLVTNLATDIDENNDTVTVDKKPLNKINKKYYLMLHKPKGYVTTLHDEKGRKTVMDFFPPAIKNIVKPIGRLDMDSEGLLLFTNDGELTKKLTHPSSGIKKHYQVKIEGKIEKSEVEALKQGTTINIAGQEVETNPAQVTVKEESPDGKFTKLDVVISEGKNREIRKMFESVGKTVVFLKRTQIGKLTLGGLPRGKFKEFDPKYTLSN